MSKLSPRRVKRKKRAEQAKRVAIIGGGLGGIAMGVKLKKAGFEAFTIFETQDGPGGTWWINDYPGAAVDIPSDMYSYSLSFGAWPWSRTHATQSELLAYIKQVVARHDLGRHFRFATTVTSLTWDESAHTWGLRTHDGEEHTFDVVVSAVGFLSVPKTPDWPGLDEFEGARFHTARWDNDYDYEGKVVAVVGVGSSSTQVVPAIAPDAKKVYVFQREPGWVLPKGERDFDEEELRRLARPLRYRLQRYRTFVAFERTQWGGAVYRTGSQIHRAAEAAARGYIESVFHDRADLREAVTPDYVFSGKRRVVSDDFYPALLRDNVELVTTGIDHLTRTGIVDVDGVEREVDLLVTATGFTAADYLNTMQVTGVGGRDLHEEWAKRGGAFAFLGMAVAGFPNFYMLYGPNTNGGAPITYYHERQADYVVSNLRRMIREDVAALDVKPLYVDMFNVWLQHRMQGTAWVEANNYFRDPSGKVVTQWPDGMVKYVSLLRLLRRPATAAVEAVRGDSFPEV